MPLTWRTIPDLAVSLLRELQVKHNYLLVTKERKPKTQLWSSGAVLHTVSVEQADWVERLVGRGLLRSVSPLVIPDSGTQLGTFYRLTMAGRYAATQGRLPALSFSEPMNFQVRVNGKVIKTYRTSDGDLTEVLTHVTENSGGAFEVYAYRKDTAAAVPLFEVDRFELSHYRPMAIVANEVEQVPVYKVVTTYGWPISEIVNDQAHS